MHLGLFLCVSVGLYLSLSVYACSCLLFSVAVCFLHFLFVFHLLRIEHVISINSFLFIIWIMINTYSTWNISFMCSLHSLYNLNLYNNTRVTCSSALSGHPSSSSIWYNPLPPKLNVNVTWSAFAPMDERNQTPNVTFGNTHAETWRFGGAGVQHSACCRDWICCPSTVSLSDVVTSFGLQTLLWKHHSACCWSFSNCAKHCLFTSKCIRFVFRPIFFYSLIRNLFQAAETLCFHR